MKKTILMVVALLCAFSCFSQVVDFEDLTLNPNSSWIGSDGTGQFSSSYLTLYNDYSTQYGSWQGFAYTNGTDTESEASTNLSSCVGHGAGNSAYYVNAYIGIDWMGGTYDPIPVGMKINTAHSGDFDNRGAYFCMPVSLKKYVDRSYASHQYYFKLKARAYANGTLVGEREIMLADFTEGHSYMMDDWTYVDLSWIENADSLDFIALSNDSGNWGINTPMYFCMDDFGAQDPNYINYTDIVDFEELTLDPDTHGNSTERTGSFTSSYLTLYSHYDEDYGPEYAYLEGFVYTNETDADTYSYTNYSAIVGHGNGNSSNYVNCYMGWYNTSAIKIDTEHSGSFENRGAYFCLPTYVSKYVDDANAHFAENGSYFSVKVTAYAAGTEVAHREIVMADFREGRTYKMDDWTYVDLSWIANADSLFFQALSEDPMVPYYFCMDDFGAEAPAEINYTEVVDFEELTLEPNTHGNSTERTGSFTSSYLTLYSHYDEDYGPEYAYLEGFVYTNETDADTYSYTNYSATVGHGNGNSSNYVNCYMGWDNTSAIKIDTEHSGDFTNRGAYFCLPTYVSKYVDDANAHFAENGSYFSVKVTAYAAGTEVAHREIVMADFREGRTYKMDDWTYVDLSWIANADSLFFQALSEDPMVPYYFCMDDFGANAPLNSIDNNFAESLSLDAYFDAAGILNLNCESRILDVCVYDMAGRLVKNVSANDNSVSMSVENRGMLIVSARTEKGMVACKVINK